MLEFQLHPSLLSHLKIVFETIKDIKNPVNLAFSADGLRLQATTLGNAALFDLHLPSDWFQQYICEDDLMVCIDLKQVCKLLKCWGSDEIATVRVDDDGSNTIHFTYRSTTENTVSVYELNTLDIPIEPIEPIDFGDRQYHAVVTIPSNVFAEICRNLISIGDNVEICVAEEEGNVRRVTFVTQGNRTNRNVFCKDTLEDDIDIAMVRKVTLSFILKYINVCAKAYKLSNRVSIGLIDDTNDKGGMLEYKLGEGHLRLYLGLRVSD